MPVKTLNRKGYLDIGHNDCGDIAWAYLSDSSYKESEDGEQNPFHQNTIHQAHCDGVCILGSGRISPKTKTGSISLESGDRSIHKKIIEFMIDRTKGKIRFFVFTHCHNGIGVQDFYDQNYL